MQEEIEIIRIAKTEDTDIISTTKKMINMCDIISIEEANEDTQDFLERPDIVRITLTYDDLCVVGSYKKYKLLFIKYGEYTRSKEIINFTKN